MNKEALKRVINILSVIPKDSHIYLRPIGDTTLVTGYDNCKIVNLSLPFSSDENWVLMADKLDYLKAEHKKMKKNDDVDIKHLYGNTFDNFVRQDTDAVMKRATSSDIEADFQVDFKILESAYKAMKDKSNIVRIQKTSSGQVIVSNMEGDVSVVAPYHSR